MVRIVTAATPRSRGVQARLDQWRKSASRRRLESYVELETGLAARCDLRWQCRREVGSSREGTHGWMIERMVGSGSRGFRSWRLRQPEPARRQGVLNQFIGRPESDPVQQLGVQAVLIKRLA